MKLSTAGDVTRARARAKLQSGMSVHLNLKNEPKPDLAEERYGMNSRAFERPFDIEWISSRMTVEM